jgi:hypothetical protein
MGEQRAARDRAYTEWRRVIKQAHREGLKIHPPWREAFENFHRDMGDPDPGMKLRRSVGTLAFTPETCYWG